MDAIMDLDTLRTEFQILTQRAGPKPTFEVLKKLHPTGTQVYNYSTKNRYADILPNEECRVKLTKKEKKEGSDYINASFCKGEGKNEQLFICTQCPVPKTFPDFWRMVWEQRVSVIVMLMNLVEENGKTNGDLYWPDQVGSTIKKGNITITLKQSERHPVQSHIVQRTFTLRHVKCNQPRQLIHLHYLGWPDYGIPRETRSIRELINLMLFYSQSGQLLGQDGPVLVHCSAGVGRAGTFLAITNALEQIRVSHNTSTCQCPCHKKHGGRNQLSRSFDGPTSWNQNSGKSHRSPLSGRSPKRKKICPTSTSDNRDYIGSREVPSLPNILQKHNVNVFAIVLRLREQRNRVMVQTESQYAFVHRVLRDELKENCCEVPTKDGPYTFGPTSPTRSMKFHPIVIHDSKLDKSMAPSNCIVLSSEDEDENLEDEEMENSGDEKKLRSAGIRGNSDLKNINALLDYSIK